jgi:hypothetical protein
MSFRNLLTAGLLAVGVLAGTASAQAAPAMPQSGLAGGGLLENVAMHHRHHRMHRHHTTRHQRRMRRMNTMRHGSPNAKNPAMRGYQQNLGNTTNGPRY